MQNDLPIERVSDTPAERKPWATPHVIRSTEARETSKSTSSNEFTIGLAHFGPSAS